MARPRKNNADYFSHDNGMRNDRKIKALRKKYNLNGYAVWNMFLEVLSESDNFEIEIDEIELELLAGDFDIDDKELKRIIDYLVKLNLLQTKNNIYWSEKLKARFTPMIEKRENMRNKYNIAKVSASEMNVSASETTQSKVKESKVKNSKDIVTLQTEVCGKEINFLLNEFKQISPMINFGNKTQRKALEEMINEMGYEKTLTATKYALSVQGKKFAPTITTPVELKNKLGAVRVFYEKNNKSNSIVL